MKKIIIITLILVALALVIIQPMEIAEMMDDFRESIGSFWTYVVTFYLVSSALLFWIGAPAGWNYAKNRFWGIWGVLICAYIGMYLSLPIALVQLLTHKKD